MRLRRRKRRNWLRQVPAVPVGWDVIEVLAVQLTPLRNDKFQSKKCASLVGPPKHFQTGYMVVGIMASMGGAVTAVAAAGGGGWG